jgi:hypothetical protein
MERSAAEEEIRMEEWASAGWREPDEEIRRLHARRLALGELPPDAVIMRQVMSGLEICHYRWEQHVENLIRSIAAGGLVSEWGSKRPEREERLRAYHSAVKAWYSGKSEEEARAADPEAAKIMARVYDSLGAPNEAKKALVKIMLTGAEGRAAEHLLEKGDWGAQALVGGAPPTPGPGEEQPKMMGEYITLHLTQQGFVPNPCHITFFENYEALLESIGEGEMVEWFKGCGIQGVPPEVRKNADGYVAGLLAWLKGEKRAPAGAGEKAEFVMKTLEGVERDPLRVWLAGCLLKSICGHLGKTVAEAAGGEVPF